MINCAAQRGRSTEHRSHPYVVIAVDVNHDGKPDLIALASGMKELVWFENPTWERHVIVDNQSRMINCAAQRSEVWNCSAVPAARPGRSATGARRARVTAPAQR